MQGRQASRQPSASGQQAAVSLNARSVVPVRASAGAAAATQRCGSHPEADLDLTVSVSVALALAFTRLRMYSCSSSAATCDVPYAMRIWSMDHSVPYLLYSHMSIMGRNILSCKHMMPGYAWRRPHKSRHIARVATSTGTAKKAWVQCEQQAPVLDIPSKSYFMHLYTRYWVQEAC